MLKRIKKNPFIRSSATLISGSFIAQSITVLSAFILARIYSPEEMGICTLVLTAESLFGGIMCLRYEVAIVSEKDELKVLGLVKVSLLITLVLSILFSFGFGWVYFIHNEKLDNYSYLIVFIFLMLLTHGIINILDAYNNRKQEYKLMTSAYVVRTIIQNVGAILLGMFGAGLLGFVGAHTIGNAGGVKKQSRELLKEKDVIMNFPLNQMKDVTKSYRNLPLYSAPAVFANRYSYSSISLFLNQLFGTVCLGFYSISYKALGLPLTILSTNVSKVFFKDAIIEYQKTGCFKHTFNKTILSLSAIVIPLGITIYYLAPFFIKKLLGTQWLIAADYIRILLPMFLVRLVVNTVAMGLQIVNKQKMELLLQMLLVIISFCAFLFTKFLNWPIEFYLQSINIGFSIIYIVFFLIVMRFAYRKVQMN